MGSQSFSFEIRRVWLTQRAGKSRQGRLSEPLLQPAFWANSLFSASRLSGALRRLGEPWLTNSPSSKSNPCEERIAAEVECTSSWSISFPSDKETLKARRFPVGPFLFLSEYSEESEYSEYSGHLCGHLANPGSRTSILSRSWP